MTDAPDELPERQRELLTLLPTSTHAAAEAMGVAPTTIEDHRNALQKKGINLQYDRSENVWYRPADTSPDDDPADDEAEQDAPDPSPDDLTERERYIVAQLQTGVERDTLADDLAVDAHVVDSYLDALREKGWQVYHDDEANLYEIEGEHTLRSSEHTGTRTRKANRWWEIRHNALERQWARLEPTTVPLVAQDGHEDWVTHLTDLHAGDVVHDYGGDVVYETADVPDVIKYVTEQSIALSRKHNATYDTAHLLYGGDLITNENIYEGQFEDLDAWLDEQVDVVQRAAIEQIYTFAEHFERVNVVCQVGNHGKNRASGTTRNNNADLLIYKHLRNYITKLQRHHDALSNVRIKIGEARPYTPVALRDGALHGQLRHGQHRKPQAETSARLKEWLSTLLDTIESSWGGFDVAWMGHHHVSGRIPWNGPPILVSGSPKPAGDYVEQLGIKGADVAPKEIAHCHGVSDDGITSIWPIDTRHYGG